MRRLTILTHFRGAAAEPSGEPPQTDPRARSVAIEVVDDDGSVGPIRRPAYENHATFTGEATFAETGSIRYDDDGELQITTLTDGALGPSAQAGVLHGAAVYRITSGTGLAAVQRPPAWPDRRL